MLEAQVGEAGDALSAHLGAVAVAIDEARGSANQFGAELERAKARLSGGPDQTAFAALVDDLAEATDVARSKTFQLEGRLAESFTEVRKLREALELARQEAATDGLSNLANRRTFDEELKRLCAEAEAQRQGTLSLALLDIDHFKTINDTWGHQTGDQVIRFVASVISQVGAPPRFAARFGGDEFAMIFSGEQAGQVEQELCDMIADIAARRLKRRDTNEPLGDITLSAGFAEHRPGETPSALMERADQALYASKRAGRNRVTGAAQAEPREPAPATKPRAASPIGGARDRVLRALRR
jgi:diguanylate cyclase